MPVNLTITIGNNTFTQMYPGNPTDKVSVAVQVSPHIDFFRTKKEEPSKISEQGNRQERYSIPAEQRTDPDGKVYKSLAAMCKAWGITTTGYRYRRDVLNMSMEDALATPINYKRRKHK